MRRMGKVLIEKSVFVFILILLLITLAISTSIASEEEFKARLSLMKDQYEPQGVLKANLSLHSPTIENQTVDVQYIIRDELTDEVVKKMNETVEVGSVKRKTLEIPLNFSWPMERMSPEGEKYATEVASKPVDFLIEIEANASSKSSSDVEKFSVYNNFWTKQRKLTFAFSLSSIILLLLILYGIHRYRKMVK